ncbi:hypothetical protein [Butyrivibrio sp. FCS014]|uniref:hypothetical protein n=1 Tax=Butyrivibrio sp. FCS014 TaxID=1408304 RepID=UPI0004B19A26|nr:hypothetical protein [Butyrivibrio sp. FCS014]
MGLGNNSKDHLIGDDGVYKTSKSTHITVFVVFCRILTAVMIVLGLVALVVGNM